MIKKSKKISIFIENSIFLQSNLMKNQNKGIKNLKSESYNV
ncbi:hypothetical protein FM120_21305 [Sphingobacterium faecium PCAi_F2.5]|nr:hypothetical protein FM120_21305 [Sphingobacterium faecium PCAi_F2.5]